MTADNMKITAGSAPGPTRSTKSFLGSERFRKLCLPACIRQAERLFDEEPDALEILRQELSSLRAEKEQILKKAGYPVDYMEMQYTCPDCKDTGYVGQKKCHCFRQKEIELLYSSSRLQSVLEKENFSTLSYDVYDETQRTSMPPIIRTCQEYALNFRRDGKSMLFYGSVGTGKDISLQLHCQRTAGQRIFRHLFYIFPAV